MRQLDVLLCEVKRVAIGLEELLKDVVFVGGSMVPLYLDDPEKEEVRITDDVDIVVEISSYIQYAKLEETLAKKGFLPDSESTVAVRKKFQGIKVDVMPSEGSVWGFSNKWYPEGTAKSKSVALAGGPQIRIFTLPYFLASKFEAHRDRAPSIDASKDLEDILLIFHGSSAIEAEIRAAESPVAEYLAVQARGLLQLPELDFRQLCDSYRVSVSRIRAVCEFICSC